MSKNRLSHCVQKPIEEYVLFLVCLFFAASLFCFVIVCNLRVSFTLVGSLRGSFLLAANGGGRDDFWWPEMTIGNLTIACMRNV